MGNLKLFSGCSCSSSGIKPKSDAPDPTDFQVGTMKAFGDFIVAQVKYPSCTNYEGNKILVFKGCRMSDIKNATVLDPHFCADCWPSPVSRFAPTDEGWLMAVSFTKIYGGL